MSKKSWLMRLEIPTPHLGKRMGPAITTLVYLYNDDMGFGIIDAKAAVNWPRSWRTQQTAHNEVFAAARQGNLNDLLPDLVNNEGLTYEFEIQSDLKVEHVELGLDIRHERLGDLIIEESPHRMALYPGSP